MVHPANISFSNSYNQIPLYDVNKVSNNQTANGMPITNNFVGEPTNVYRQSNNLSPNYMKQVYSSYLAPSNGSTTESFLKAKASFSSNFRHNEKATRYQMVSEINQKLYKMQKKIDLFI